ncbi:MAG TPA: tetratricopeptide repeat protein, partial [Burkholderiaceae bacterium]|nr:tetratricopeptide repeat protein [Burkholderiaceae bacterium]
MQNPESVMPRAPDLPILSVDELLAQAISSHQAWRYDEAEAYYRAVLAAQPGHGDANHNLGVLLAIQLLKPALALPYFEAALDAQVGNTQYWLSYIDALIRAGQAELARQMLPLARAQGLSAVQANAVNLRVAASLAGADGADLPEAESASPLQNLQAEADAHHDAGQFEEEARVLQALLAEQADASVHYRLGMLLSTELRRPGQALPHFEAALNVQAGNVMYWTGYVDALLRDEKPELARQVVEMARGLGVQMEAMDVWTARPSDGPAAHPAAKREVAKAASPNARHAQRQPPARKVQELAELLQKGEFQKARAAALAMTEEYAAHGLGWKVLAGVLKALGDTDGAVRAGLQAIKRWPDDPEALSNLGNALREKNRLSEAEAHLKKAIVLKPEHAIFHNNLGMVFQGQGRRAEAEAAFRRALEISPDYEDIFGNLLFVLNYHPDAAAEEIYEAYREYDRRFGQPMQGQWRAHSNSKEAGRRLKVGYVSPDFRQHSCRHFMEPLLAHHDKEAVEVFAYAELAREDNLSARYKSYVEHWIPTRG